MRVIIAGGRDIEGETARVLIRHAIYESGWTNKITMIIHGGARGIDREAGEMFKNKWPVHAEPAKWTLHGKSAGPIRNRVMADNADALIALWDGQSKGTADMIKVAIKKGLKVFVLRVDEYT